MSADIVILDCLPVHYGPETEGARSLLRGAVAAGLDRFRPADQGGTATSIRPCPSKLSMTRSRNSSRRVKRNARCRARPLTWPSTWVAPGCCCSRTPATPSLSHSCWFWFSGSRSFSPASVFCTEERHRDRCPPRLCIIGLRCHLFDPRTRSIVRENPSGVQRPVARVPKNF